MVMVDSGDAGDNDDDGDWQCGQQNRTEENKMQQNRTGENRGEGPDQRVAVVAQGETDHTPHVWRYIVILIIACVVMFYKCGHQNIHFQ